VDRQKSHSITLSIILKDCTFSGIIPALYIKPVGVWRCLLVLFNIPECKTFHAYMVKTPSKIMRMFRAFTSLISFKAKRFAFVQTQDFSSRGFLLPLMLHRL
jgi:hypothetical protein